MQTKFVIRLNDGSQHTIHRDNWQEALVALGFDPEDVLSVEEYDA